MKKLILIITIILSICFIPKVYAKSYNVALTGNSTFEKEITLTIKVNNVTGFSGGCNGLCGMVAKLNYDSSKLELVSVNKNNDFIVTYNKNKNLLVIERDTGVGSGSSLVTIKFRNKALTKDESTTISLTGIKATDGSEDITTNDVTKTIKLIVKENNKVEKPVIKKSNNNYLKLIELNNGKINFNKEELTYNVTVSYDVTSIKIIATTEDITAKIKELKDEYELTVGENTINILVQAEDQSERVYTLVINREEQETVVEPSFKEEPENVENTDDNIYIVIIGILIIISISLLVALIKHKKR